MTENLKNILASLERKEEQGGMWSPGWKLPSFMREDEGRDYRALAAICELYKEEFSFRKVSSEDFYGIMLKFRNHTGVGIPFGSSSKTFFRFLYHHFHSPLLAKKKALGKGKKVS